MPSLLGGPTQARIRNSSAPVEALSEGKGSSSTALAETRLASPEASQARPATEVTAAAAPKAGTPNCSSREIRGRAARASRHLGLRPF